MERRLRKQFDRVVRGTKRYVCGLNYTGLLFALVFYCFSMLPSLLPRPWLFQGLISGISLAVGYGCGVLASVSVRWMFEREPSKIVKLWAWRILVRGGGVLFVAFLLLGYTWQQHVHELVGESPPDGRHLTATFLTLLLTAVLLLGLGRSVRRMHRWISGRLQVFLPRRVGVGLGFVVVALCIWWLLSGVLFDGFVTQANKFYANKNTTTPVGIVQPTSSNRSGSPESLVPWDTVGYQGKNFVARGPSQEQMRNYSHEDPKEQIRIYVGMDSAADATDRAQLAVKELQRTKAFDRKVLVLATATGTGWLEPQSVDSIEYMHNGDTAIVTQQYSFLPSWISFLVDTENAKDAGRALYDAVYAEWSKLPQESRPKLIAYGLSLGSFGGQAAYTSVNDLRASIDGALFMGTPNNTEMWRNVTDHRDMGSPEWQPTYEQGTAVRFAATNETITADQAEWQFPRVLYMQHASDPVVWFSFSLPFQKPDWLREPRGYDVSESTKWFPIVSFLQITVDQFFGVTVPNGHGHNYANTIVNAWGAIVPPVDWNQTKAAELQKIIDTYSNE